MPDSKPLLLPGRTAPRFTMRALLTVLFRQKRILLIAFLAVLIPALLAAWLLPGEYATETKIVMERQRFDPIITSGFRRDDMQDSSLARLEEQDIDSEVDLLQSDMVLRQVVMDLGLWQQTSKWRSLLHLPQPSQEVRIAKAVKSLRKSLVVEPPNRSKMVTVRYFANDPQQAARTLQAISNAYLNKHLEIHRPAGSSEFFNQEVERNRRDLDDANTKLLAFTQKYGVIEAGTEGGTVLQKMGDFEANRQTTQAQVRATEDRIANLQSQIKTASPRIITRVRNSPVLLENMRSNLYNLEQKRADLLSKYQPDYRPVQDLDRQIAATRQTIAEAEKAPPSEETTDVDPVHSWLTGELAKARAELVSLKASAVGMDRSVALYHGRAEELGRLGTQQTELKRTVNLASDAYQASLRKQAEARMSEALDRARIMNVAVAEAALPPALPVVSPLLKSVFGFFVALLVGIGAAFAAEYWDPTFRTPEEIEHRLQIPVLASLPRAEFTDEPREERLLA